jgi:hypothetical protein
MMKNILELAELFKNIALGLFVNGSYGILKGENDISNWYICIGSITAMYLAIKIQRSIL